MNACSTREKTEEPSLGRAKASPIEITVRPLSMSIREMPELSEDEATSMAAQGHSGIGLMRARGARIREHVRPAGARPQKRAFPELKLA
jgi:hypothetical protein